MWATNNSYGQKVKDAAQYGLDHYKNSENNDAYYDCKSAGCVGDGVSDDTAAMQRAINTAITQGKILFLSEGDYKITRRLEIGAALTVIGCSTKATRLLWSGVRHTETPYDLEYWPESNAAILIKADNCRLSNFTLEQLGAATANGIIFHQTNPETQVTYFGAQRCALDNVDIRKFINGVFIYAGWNRTFTHCQFVDNTGCGIKYVPLEPTTTGNWSGSGDIITACQFVGNDVAGFYAEGLFECTCWNSVFEYNQRAIIIEDCNDVTFKNCWNEANYDKLLITGCAKFEGGYNINSTTVEHIANSTGDIVVFEDKASVLIKTGDEIVYQQQGGYITKGVKLAAEVTNLFTNSDFGTDGAPSSTGWDVYVDPQPTGEVKYGAANTAHYHRTGYTEDQGFGMRQTIPVTPGKSYTFSVYAMSPDRAGIDSIGLVCYVAHKNGAGETSWFDNTVMPMFAADNAWELKSRTVEATGDDATLVVGFGCARNGQAYFAQPSFSDADALVANDVFIRAKDATTLDVINMSGVKIGTIAITPA